MQDRIENPGREEGCFGNYIFMSYVTEPGFGDFPGGSPYNLAQRCASVHVEAIRRACSKLVDNDVLSYRWLTPGGDSAVKRNGLHRR